MDGTPEEPQAGLCPLCLAALPEPRRPGDLLPILERHFALDCQALAIPPRWQQVPWPPAILGLTPSPPGPVGKAVRLSSRPTRARRWT